jgi:hypothetical protein
LIKNRVFAVTPNLLIYLTDLDGTILTQIAAEQVAIISPAESYSGAWTVGLQDIKVEPRAYILKLELSDAHDLLVFTVESAPIVIQQGETSCLTFRADKRGERS